jgi:hypothetical protein
MLIRVNKKISASKTVKYAALSTGTISHVWYDEASELQRSAKRTNHIRLTRARDMAKSAEQRFDA